MLPFFYALDLAIRRSSPVVATDFSGIVRKAISGFVAFELLVRRDLHYFAFFYHASGLICILIHIATVPALFVCTILHSSR